MNIVRSILLVLATAWTIAASAGDASRGSTLYHATYQCNDCHEAHPTAASLVVIQGSTAADLLSQIQLFTEMRQRYARSLGQSQMDLDDIAAYLASLQAAPATTDVIEYHHAAFDHYFITANPNEIAKLDAGVFAGWSRTGYSFKGYPVIAPGTAAVCRFFSTAFAPRSSHFYTPFAAECGSVKNNPDWQFEGEVLFIAVAATDGTCPSGTSPVYRLYNNGQGGAPNHRYTIDASQRDRMLALGYVLEGNGPGFAFMCAPA